jgi:leucyl aminopeptidase
MASAAAEREYIPIHLVRQEELERWLTTRDAATRNWIVANGFTGERSKYLLLPGASGELGAVLVGVGNQPIAQDLNWLAASLAERLPEGRYRLAHELSPRVAERFAFGWGYGEYRYARHRSASTKRKAQLLPPAGIDEHDVIRMTTATAFARDLINAPANILTPAALAESAAEIAQRFGARHRVIVGDDLIKERFPAVHAVGRAAACAPRLFDMSWGDETRPRVTLVGKGVCFDSGGLDLKPKASMLLMKKDMGGAAMVLALTRMIMGAALPVRLRVVLPIVENAVSSHSYRPGDVLDTRRGLSVEVGNTDAEGRLILSDALALADEDAPDLLIDIATLTGAARVALGPELPALFATDDAVADELLSFGREESDPLWRMPLWTAYDDELSSNIADLNNASPTGFSGAIIGALFLRRFVCKARTWMHLDVHAWNGKERPGRPIGAEPHTVRALYALLKHRYQH